MTPSTLATIAPPLVVSVALSVRFITDRAFRVDGNLYYVLFDDAMISMRYARNLATGHGLVWNVGDPPVEGYTNFLWTLWMAALHLPGAGDGMTPLLVSASGGLILLLNGLAMQAVARRLVPDSAVVPVLTLWLVSTCLALVFWTLVGLEVGLIALLGSLAMLLALRLRQAYRRRDLLALATILAAAVLVRTDQVVLCIAVIGLLGFWMPAGSRKPVLVLGLTVVATLVAHTLFRLVYYGDLLPNAYHLKLSGATLAARLTRGSLALGSSVLKSLAAPLAFALVGLWRASPATRRSLALPLTVFLGCCAYSTVVGGDAWEYLPVPNRFLTAGMPALLLVSAVGVSSVVRLDAVPRRRILSGMAIALALVLAAGSGAETLLDAWQAPGGGVVTVWRPSGRGSWILALSPIVLLGLGALSGGPGWRVSSWTRAGSWSLVACGAAVLVATNGPALRMAVGPRLSPHRPMGVTLTHLALAVRDATSPTASVAVTWAGVVPYFSRRPAVDMLGRSDHTIARMARRGEAFWPGHDKWDYAHSVGRLRPDVIVQLWRPTADDLAGITGFGYDRLLPSLFVRADSTGVDRVRLERVVCALFPDDAISWDFPDRRLALPGPAPRWDWERIWRDRCGAGAG